MPTNTRRTLTAESLENRQLFCGNLCTDIDCPETVDPIAEVASERGTSGQFDSRLELRVSRPVDLRPAAISIRGERCNDGSLPIVPPANGNLPEIRLSESDLNPLGGDQFEDAGPEQPPVVVDWKLPSPVVGFPLPADPQVPDSSELDQAILEVSEELSRLSNQREPLLKDIPYVGRLFKNEAVDDSKRTLEIFVTPRVVVQLESID